MFLNIIKLWYHGRLKRRLRRTITKIHPLADSEGWAGWVSKPYMEVGSGSVWLNVTVKQLLLIHKQQATNRAAILWGNHWGGRRGGGGCGAQRAGLSNCCNFPFIILIRQLRSQWKPDARGARLPGKKYVPGVHAGSQEPPTSKLRRVNTLPRHKFGVRWGHCLFSQFQVSHPKSYLFKHMHQEKLHLKTLQRRMKSPCHLNQSLTGCTCKTIRFGS